MTVPASNYPYGLGGLSSGGYWQTTSQIYGNSSGIADPYAIQRAYSQLAAQNSITQLSSYYPEPDPIENAGIVAGEVIAWRCWRYEDGFLSSMFADYVWAPSQIAEGDPDVSGIHAWKSAGEALAYAHSGFCVVGRVALWGEVVEHERGYRAQFGKVHSLDYVRNKFWKFGLLARLRKKYLEAA